MDRRGEVRIQRAAELCEANRLEGYHCSESSIRAVAQALDLELPESLLRVSSGFRGGGGGYGDRCGVVEAGIMLISHLYGRTDPKVDVSGYSYLVRLLHDRFNRELGSYYCRVLKPLAHQFSGADRHCGFVYQNGARILANLLLEAEQLIKDMPEQERFGYKDGSKDEATKVTKYPRHWRVKSRR